ncbi:MAG: tandem-95 repeat protein, partial [Burkholderiaceae bacterium]
MAGLHRMNYGVAEGLALIGGDLTKLTPLELTPFSHQTISDNLNNLQNAIPIANNSLSLTWSSYVSILFSKPGETAAGISLGLQTYLGIPKPLANVLGAAAELSMRTLPITRVAQAIQLLIGGYALGQAVGSQTTAEVSFPTLQSGWTRTNLTPSDSEAYLQGWRFVLDTNSQTGVQVVRSGGGYSEEVHPDGTIIYSHPQFGLGVFNPDGSGTLHLKEIDPLTGDIKSARVSIEANTHIELTADGWRTVKPLDATGDQVQLTYYTGTKRTIYEGSYNIVDKEGKPARIFSISNEYHASLATDFSLPEENLSWTVNRSDLGNGHILIVTRDDDRRVVKVVEEKILETGRRLVTTSDGSGTIHSTRLEEKINDNTARTITRDGDGNITEIHVVQIYSIDKETFVLDDVANHIDNTRTLTVRDANGNIKKTDNISIDAAPLQMTDKAINEMQMDVVSFLNALRQKDKAGIIISTARLVLDYAHTQGVVPAVYDTLAGDASSALNFVGSLRALQSGDMLAQVGGAVGLLNSTNYFASRMAANNTGFLSTTQTQVLNTAGAILSIANLANLGSMIDNNQFGSAAATVVTAANSIAYLTSASTSLMGTGALFPINPIAMIVIAYALDTMFAEDPPPPPPQGVVHFVCEADGRLGYRITECNDLGKSILSGQVDLLLPKLEAQLAQANGGICNNDHALLLVASRMPAVRLSAWPSHADNGVSNYFFVLEQSDPLKDDPNYVGVARQDLLRLYAETLVLPEALVQQWEVDHLRQKFGPDEANWQTEGEWLRGRSPTEKQRALLQKEVDRSTAAWQASATVKLALSSWFESGNVAVQKQNDAAQEASRLCMEEAKAALAAYTELHPLDPFEVARATPEQERDFAQTHQARETVSLQWLKVITVDLGGDGVCLIDLPGNVGTDLESLRQQQVARFDVDGDGFVEATQWIAPSEAILGIDRSGNGLIDNGSELFNETDTPFDQHGLAELAYYDANGDGSITEADPVYKHLRLWVDLDSDGSAGALEVFDMQMHSALSGAADSAAPSGTTDVLAAMVVTAIDLSTMRMQFADSSSAPLLDTALLSHTKGLKIVMDEATANLNVLHEDGLRENFITLTQDMSVLQELQSATLSSTRCTELEALARRYGLNPASADFAGIVQSLRATGETLGQQDTVIYFGDDAVWVDPQVRQRLEQMRISFRKLGDRAADSIASANQLGRFGTAPDSQALNADGSFNDRWVASHQLSAVDIISDAASVPETENSQPEQWLLPADVYSLLQVTKGAQSGGLVTEQAIIASDRAFPQAPPQTIQVFATAQPVAQLRSAQLRSDEDGVVSFSYTQLEQEARLLLAASDPGASVQLLGIRSALHGTVQLDDAAGRLSFNAQTNYTGEAGFTIVLMNQQGQVLEREIAIDLREVNDAPVVAGETIHSREDIPLLIDTAMLLANDHDMEADAMRITGIGRVGLGKAELLGNGQIHYTPPSDQYGITDTLEYIVQDSRGASSVGKINIILDPVDDAPSVVSERIINAREDQTLRIASRLLLWNDIDLDTDARLGAAPLTITAVGSPEHGMVRLESGGEIVFVPEANYNGEAAFSYTVRDETGLSTTGRALIRIDPVNDAPLVSGEQIASKEDERLVIDPTLLLTNEFDLDITRGEKQSLSVAAVDQATGGRVQMQDGLIVFVPDANLHGAASFRYTVSDGDGGFAQGKVAITLAPVNDGPVLPPVSLTAAEDTTLLIPTARLLEGVSDVDGENTSFQLLSVDNAIGGTVEWLNQQVIFHPDADYAGTASFCYTVADAEGACSTGVAAININNANDAPALIAGSRFEPAGEEDQEIRISESALVKLFLDADGDSMQVAASTLCAENTGDSIRFDSTKKELVFRAAENANGLREIRYAVTDGQAISAMQTLNITLRPVNDAPIVNAVGFQMLEDGGQTNPSLNAWSYLSYASLLCNSSDPDGDALTVSAVAGGQTADKVRLAVEVVNDVANKRIAIKAPLNYNGAIELSFTVQDSKGASTTQKAYGMVTPVNDTPLLSVQKTGSKEIRIAFSQVTQETWKINAWDPDANDTVSFMVERNPLRGAVSLGAATTTPDPSGGVRVEAMITTLSGFGSVKSTEAAWFSASDKAGAKSLINIAFTGRYDPIVIDLGQDGLGFINIANSQVWLDTQGDDVLRRSAW